MRASGRWKWIFPVVLIACVLCVAVLLYAYTQPGGERIYLTPMFGDPKGWEIYTQEGDARTDLPPREALEMPGRTLYLSRVMEEAYEEDGVTYVELSSAQPAIVFLNGELLYTTSPQIDPSIGEIHFPADYEGLPGRGEAIRFSLPAGFAGKTLTIATTVSDLSGLPMVVLSSQALSDAETASAVSRAAMPAAAYAVAFLLLLAVFLYAGFAKKWDFSLLLLLLAAFAQCLHSLAAYESVTVPYYALSVPASAFFQSLFIYLPMLFLLSKMSKWRRLCTPILLAPLLLSLIPPACTVIGLDIGMWYAALSNMAYLAFLVLLVFSIFEAKNGNTVFRLFLSGLGLTVVCIACLCADAAVRGGWFDEYVWSTLRSAFDGFGSSLFDWMGVILFLLCTGVSFILLVRNIARTQTQMQMLSVKNDLAVKNLQTMRQSSEAVAAARHNMIHHLAAMQGLLRAGETDRLLEYLSRLLQETTDIYPVQIAAHPLVNAILSMIQGRSREADVETDFQVDIPDTLSIPDNDLCNFLLNMLDNALQAASEMPPGEKRWLRFTMHVRKQYLFIETENPYHGEVALDPSTGLYASPKGAGHGYGMKTMLEIARKYHSALQTEAENGVFLVRTALLLPG